MKKRSSVLLLSLCLIAAPEVSLAKNWQGADGTRMVKFDDELYTLSYNTFLANKNLNDAYLVAKSAVAQRPDNVAWRIRLAKVAQWTNRPRLAFGIWYQLAIEDKSLDAVDNALVMAKSLNEIQAQEKLLKIKLKKDPGNPEVVAQLIKIEELLGKPERSMALLEKHHEILPNVDHLKELARLHKDLGQTDQEVLAIQKMEQGGKKDIALVMRESEILYSKGQFTEALARLKDGENGYQTTPEYWLALANLSWHENDTPTALHAYKKLVSLQKADGQAYARVLQLVGNDDPEYTYEVSKQAWAKTPESSYFFSLLTSGSQLKRWPELQKLLKTIPPEQRAVIEAQPYYWEMNASIPNQLGDIQLAQKNYQLAMQRFPSNQAIRLSYAWFLVEQNQIVPLQLLLTQWQSDFMTNPAFSSLYINILQQLGFTWLAIEHAAKQYPQKNASVVWLNQFTQLLDAVEPPLALSYLLKWRAWQVQKNFPRPGNPQLDMAVAQIANQIADADTAMKAIYRVEKQKGFRELMMGWSLAQEAPDITHFVRDRMPSVTDVAPPWADLTLSLQDYDKDKLHYLLTEKSDQLQYRDAVSAEQAISDLPAAEDWAVVNLEKHPDDGLLYAQMTELMETHANRWTVYSDYQSQNGVAGFYPKAALRYFFRPQDAVLVETDRWIVKPVHADVPFDMAVPHRFHRTAVGILHLIQRGLIELKIAEQQAFNHFYTATMRVVYRISDRFTLTTDVGLNTQALDTTQLMFVGLKDILSFQGVYKFSRTQQLIGELSLEGIRDQQRYFLGRHQQGYFAFEQSLRDTYPDLSFRIFATKDHYHPSNPLSLFVRDRYFDPTVNIDTLIPRDFYQYGVSVQWGEDFRTRYTKPWHPFVVASVFKNTQSGMAYYGVAGVAGKVFGRDHLALYYERAKGQGAQAQLNELIGVSYSRYF